MGVREKNQEKILKMLSFHGSLSLDSVKKSLGLSEASVRRYFADMEHSGEAVRYHGGIRLAAEGNSGYRFTDAAASFTAEKHLIGMRAALEICEHDRLFFDSGTTALECGGAMSERINSKELTDLRIVTNSLAFGTGIAPRCPVILTGGRIRLDRMDLCGNTALENVRRYNFTKAFLGTDAVSETGLLSTTDEETSALAAAVLKQSQALFILADSSKLGKSSFVPYGSLTDPKTTLVTDDAADPALLAKLRKAGVKIIIASNTAAERKP